MDMVEIGARRAQTRTALIEGAVHVLATKGTNASIEDFCDGAGFTRGAFYSNFASRTDFYLAMYEHYLVTDLSAAQQAIALSDSDGFDASEIIHKAIDVFLSVLNQNVERIIVMQLIRIFALNDPKLSSGIVKIEQNIPQILDPVLASMFDELGLKPRIPIRTLVTVMRSVYIGSLLDDRLDDTLDPHALRTTMTSLLASLLKPTH